MNIKGGFLFCYKDEIELDFPLKYYTGNSYLIGVDLIPYRHNYGMITKTSSQSVRTSQNDNCTKNLTRYGNKTRK